MKHTMKNATLAFVSTLPGLLPGRAPAQDVLPVSWPSHTLSNGVIRLNAYAPVPETGYYQAVRFDWSSLLGDIDVDGHRFLVEHHAKKHNPHGHDHVAGPAEEFDLETPPPGFAEAGPDGLFLKIGVGVLRRPDSRGYSFSRAYDVVDHGTWTFTPEGATSVVYRHSLSLPDGSLGYELNRRVSLVGSETRILIERSIVNTGAKPLRTRHYAHNFVRIGDHGVGRDHRVELPFQPLVVTPEILPDDGVLEERAVGFLPESLKRTFWVCLGGFDATPEHNRVTVRHVPSGASVSFATDRPLADLRIYATAGVLCPEPFVDLEVAPGETWTWNTEISFETP